MMSAFLAEFMCRPAHHRQRVNLLQSVHCSTGARSLCQVQMDYVSGISISRPGPAIMRFSLMTQNNAISADKMSDLVGKLWGFRISLDRESLHTFVLSFAYFSPPSRYLSGLNGLGLWFTRSDFHARSHGVHLVYLLTAHW